MVVENVGGPAARAGIEAGDVLLAINGRPVQSVDQVKSVLSGKPKSVALLVPARRREDLRAGQARLIDGDAAASMAAGGVVSNDRAASRAACTRTSFGQLAMCWPKSSDRPANSARAASSNPASLPAIADMKR
jgi:predicted metalloprotease with PDZ domain